jgi:hypothetical protein
MFCRDGIKDGDGAPNGYSQFFSSVNELNDKSKGENCLFSSLNYIREEPRVSIWRVIPIGSKEKSRKIKKALQ